MSPEAPSVFGKADQPLSAMNDEDQLQEVRKRKVGDETEEEEEDEQQAEGKPPRKQCRPNPEAETEAADPAQCQADPSEKQRQQQLTDRKNRISCRVRFEGRLNFSLIINDFLPSMIKRLVSFKRRSLGGEAERILCSNRKQKLASSVSPVDAQRKVNLTPQLESLLLSAQRLLSYHEQPVKPYEDAADCSGMTWSAQRLHRLTSDAMHLALQHMSMLDIPNQVEEKKQKRCLDEIRLILYNEVFGTQRLEEPPLERQSRGPNDFAIRDTWELVKLVCNELRQVVVYADDMNKWLTTQIDSAPDAVMALSTTAEEKQVRSDALEIFDGLAKLCSEKLSDQVKFLAERSALALSASETPQREKHRMKKLEGFEVTQGFVWRNNAQFVVARCERLLEFVQRHVEFLLP